MRANICTIVGCVLLALSGCGNKEADEPVDTPNESEARDAAPGPLSETTPPSAEPGDQPPPGMSLQSAHARPSHSARRPSDAAALAELAARTFTDAFASGNRPEDLQAHLASSYGVSQQSAEIADPNTITLLADRGGALIGYAQVRRHTVPSCVTQAQPVELQRFYLDRSAHGTGVAKELMSAVHEAARELGGRNLWLGVWERNARAIAFYSKMGFTKVGSHELPCGLGPADR